MHPVLFYSQLCNDLLDTLLARGDDVWTRINIRVEMIAENTLYYVRILKRNNGNEIQPDLCFKCTIRRLRQYRPGPLSVCRE